MSWLKSRRFARVHELARSNDDRLWRFSGIFARRGFRQGITKMTKGKELLLPESRPDDEGQPSWSDRSRWRDVPIAPRWFGALFHSGKICRDTTQPRCWYYFCFWWMHFAYGIGSLSSQALDRTHRWAKKSLEHHLKLSAEETSQVHTYSSADESLCSARRPAQALGNLFLRKQQFLLYLELCKVDVTNICEKSRQNIWLTWSRWSWIRWFRYRRIFWKEIWVLPYNGQWNFAGEQTAASARDRGAGRSVSGSENGVDTFDCVAPTRNGRTGTVYTHEGKKHIGGAPYVEVFSPIEKDCGCYTCRITLALTSITFLEAKKCLLALSHPFIIYFCHSPCCWHAQGYFGWYFWCLQSKFFAKYKQSIQTFHNLSIFLSIPTLALFLVQKTLFLFGIIISIWQSFGSRKKSPRKSYNL